MHDQTFWNTTWTRPYHRYSRHHEAIWNVLLTHLKGAVLDLGCGPAVLYRNSSIALVGVDWSLAALVQARQNYPQGTYIRADARSTGLSDKQFDTVLLMGVLDYFEDWQPFIQEALRLCRGKILITLLDGWQGHNWNDETLKKHIGVPFRVQRDMPTPWVLIEIDGQNS